MDIYVVSHQPRSRIPEFVLDVVPANRVFFEPNIGYDWGCYQQFLDKGIWRHYDYTIFMHDDIQVVDPGFVKRTIEMLQVHPVVGNANLHSRPNNPEMRSFSYAHASWKPPTPGFTHSNLRGSYIAATRQALERLGRFEVYWDPFHLTSRFGNWSTKASCARWQHALEGKPFGFLSDEGLESDYLIEFVRGGSDQEYAETFSNTRTRSFDRIRRWSNRYMELYWSEKKTIFDYLWMRLIKIFLVIFDGSWLYALTRASRAKISGRSETSRN